MRTLLVLMAALMPGACASPGSVEAPPVVRSAQILLLGEVHDNDDGHRQRLALLEALIEKGWRPAIAMEQFDIERQPALDEAMRDCGDAPCVVQRAGGKNWAWSFYLPVIQLVRRHGLPLLAANLSRDDAVQVMRTGFAAAFDTDTQARLHLSRLPADMLAVQSQEMIAGHCKKLPATMIGGMVKAQIARDIAMARVVGPHASRGVVLLAGNGHIRKDVGVPHWLANLFPAARVASAAFTESSGNRGENDRYDVVYGIAPQRRDDPCAGI